MALRWNWKLQSSSRRWSARLAFGFKAELLFRLAMDSRLLSKRSFYQFSYGIDRNSVVDTVC
jgi:hypothetical protein